MTVVAVHSEGLGLIAGISGPTLGYSRESIVASTDPDACQITILAWPKDPEAARTLASTVSRGVSVCSAGEISK